MQLSAFFVRAFATSTDNCKIRGMSVSIELSGIYLGIGEAAKQIGVTDSRLRQMIRNQEVKAICVSDRVWLMEKAEVDRIKSMPQKTGRPRNGS